MTSPLPDPLVTNNTLDQWYGSECGVGLINERLKLWCTLSPGTMNKCVDKEGLNLKTQDTTHKDTTPYI